MFNARLHVEVMRLAYADYARLVKPKVANCVRRWARG